MASTWNSNITGRHAALAGLILYLLDLTYRLSQWGVMSGLHCTYVAADNSFVTLRITFNKVHLHILTFCA